MKRTTTFVLVLVTAPELKTARRLTRLILTERLAACVNLVPRLESHYWWRDKMEKANEVLLLIKTNRKTLPRLEQVVLAAHPYETPEFVVLPFQAGSDAYFQWLAANCR